MNNTTNLPTAAGAGGAALAVVTILVWIGSFWHVAVPDTVVSAATVLIAFAAHWIALQVRSGAPAATDLQKGSK